MNQPDNIVTLPLSEQRLAVYLINMDGADQRLSMMKAKLNRIGLPYRRIPGVDGRKLSFPIPEFCRQSYRFLHGRRTNPAEIGCYLSHIACARAYLQDGADLALILEDDVSFDRDFLNALDLAALHREEWNLLRLTTVNRGRKYPILDLDDRRSLSIALTREKGAGAYVIDRRAAEWFVNDLVPMRLAFDIAFDLEYLDGLRACFIDPQPASQVSEHETQIQANWRTYKLPRWRYVTVLPYRAWLELSRVACRGWRLGTCRLGSRAQAADRGRARQQAGPTGRDLP